MRRRALLQGAMALALSSVATSGPDQRLRSARASAPRTILRRSATPVPEGITGYAFNAKTQNVTLFDPVTHQVLTTKPLGAVVRWLSNEQRFWDGRYLWTYDFPEDRVQAIGIDPETVRVARTLPTGGAGPAHSLMLTPDRTTAWVNVAGDDSLAVLDLASGEVIDTVRTGKYP
jgi:DNA-binding beta-propeller fold protein YncE